MLSSCHVREADAVGGLVERRASVAVTTPRNRQVIRRFRRHARQAGYYAPVDNR